jgi:hypothetical protein
LFVGTDAASWPPLSRRWQVGELAAALLEVSLTGTQGDGNGRFLTKSGQNRAFFAYFCIKCTGHYLLESII